MPIYKCPKCFREFKAQHFVKYRVQNNFFEHINDCSGIMRANFKRHLKKCGVDEDPFNFLT